MLDRSTIRHIHWQLAAGQTVPTGGGIVTGYDDIEQEMRTIVLTPIGSVPCNPTKGCDLLAYIDRPPAEALPLICRDIWLAIATWVSRIEVQPVEARQIGFAHFGISVPWRVKGDIAAEIRQTEMELLLRDGQLKAELV
ncbi:MAG TPA: GPW/gp25 family protein [Ancylobacter sp.]